MAVFNSSTIFSTLFLLLKVDIEKSSSRKKDSNILLKFVGIILYLLFPLLLFLIVLCQLTTDMSKLFIKRFLIEHTYPYFDLHYSFEQTHMEECLFALVKCENCEMEVTRRDMTSHKQTCPRRIESCDHCSAAVVFADLPVCTLISVFLYFDLKPYLDTCPYALQFYFRE